MGKIKTNKSSFSIFGDSVRDTKRTSVPLFAANLYGDGGGKGQAVAQGVGGGVYETEEDELAACQPDQLGIQLD